MVKNPYLENFGKPVDQYEPDLQDYEQPAYLATLREQPGTPLRWKGERLHNPHVRPVQHRGARNGA